MSIKPLPEDVIRRITSSATITSLNGVVCGLIRNSLDSSATKINITVDYSRGNCTVEDDGLGILPIEFREAGGLGKLYHTSRHSSDNETHGTSGNFLASLAALSLLSISSHHYQHNSQNSLTIHSSKVVARNIPALPEQRLFAFSHGTRVMVRDLFGSMAVRVKQRTAASEKAAVDKEWDRLVHDITSLLLAWPSPVSLYARDTLHNNEARFRPNAPTRTIANTDLVAHSSLILAQSGLADEIDYASWIPIGAFRGKLTIDGCISLNPVATRRGQFISFGVQPLANGHGTNVLYAEVNRVFLNSGFDIAEDVSMYRDQDAVSSNAEPSARRIVRPKRGMDRWPMFYFRITSSSRAWPKLSSSFEDLLEERNRTLSDIVDLLKLVSHEFLKKHHFRPHKVTTSFRGSRIKRTSEGFRGSGCHSIRKAAEQPRPVPLASSRSNFGTPVSRPDSPFDLWQRVKAGRSLDAISKSGSNTPESFMSTSGNQSSLSSEESTNPILPPSLRFLDNSGNVVRRPFDNLASLCPPRNTPDQPTDQKGETALPEVVVEPAREIPAETDLSGIKEPLENKHPTSAGSLNASNRIVASAFQRFKEITTMPPQEPSDWLKGVLSNWENPVFQPVERPIPRINDVSFGDAISKHSVLKKDEAGCCRGTHTSNIKLSGRLSKAALAGAEVVSQVDQKFVLVKMGREQLSGTKCISWEENSVLVLIDQHAADERCRLESLMQNYFEKAEGREEVIAKTQLLEKPLQFEFSTKECILLRRYVHHLRRWGVFYKLEDPETAQWRHRSKQLPKVAVLSLPPSILERCRVEPKLAVQLLRNEIWKLEEEGRPIERPFIGTDDASGGDVSWVSNFHGCPQGILELLNSRSCRSAMMFNDVLSKDDCIALVKRLSQCAFPFQCAHGRPSMVPLVDMRSLNISQKTHVGSFGSQLKESGLMK